MKHNIGELVSAGEGMRPPSKVFVDNVDVKKDKSVYINL